MNINLGDGYGYGYGYGYGPRFAVLIQEQLIEEIEIAQSIERKVAFLKGCESESIHQA